MKRKATIPPKPVKSPQVPVTVSMLNEMEGRLSHKIDAGLTSLRGELSSQIASVRSELTSFKSDVADRFSSMSSDISSIKSDVSSMKSELHRVALLVEEQNSRNKFVLDGYAQLYELIERKLG